MRRGRIAWWTLLFLTLVVWAATSAFTQPAPSAVQSEIDARVQRMIGALTIENTVLRTQLEAAQAQLSKVMLELGELKVKASTQPSEQPQQ